MNWRRLDFINPLDGLWGRTAHGSMHRFSFSIDSDFSAFEIEKLLRRYGIHIWGRKLESDTERSFLVKRRQAVWAEYLLCRAGVPLTCPLLDPRNEAYRRRHLPRSMPIPWTSEGSGPASLLDHVLEWMDKLLP